MKESQTIRIIDSFSQAENGWCAVVALENPVKIVKTKGWWIFKKKVETLMDHVYLPVAFFANAFMHKRDSNGDEMRTNSFLVAMVRVGDGIEAAASLDGYIGLVSPDEESIDEVFGMREAVTEWRNNHKQQRAIEREESRRMMN
jgi:hypothetical protein